MTIFDLILLIFLTTSIQSTCATEYFITYVIMACILLIGTAVFYIIDKISEREHERNRRRNRNPTNLYREILSISGEDGNLPRCRVCGLPIHNIPEIEEKSLVIGGVEIFVEKFPLCCECYEQYKKWSKIIESGVEK